MVDSVSFSHQDQVLILGSFVITALAVIIGIRVSRRQERRFDPFHPLVLPLGYISFSYLAPIAYTAITGVPVGALALGQSRSPETAGLLALGVIGFLVGSSIGLSRRLGAAVRQGPEASVQSLRASGHIFLCISLALKSWLLVAVGLSGRGAGQGEFTALDSLSVGASALGISGAVLVCFVAKGNSKSLQTLPIFDTIILTALLCVQTASGDRGEAVAVLLVIAFSYRQRGGKLSVLVLGVLIIVMISPRVVAYRSGNDLGATTAIQRALGDMAVTGFSTGVTAHLVPSAYPYEHGSTIAAGLVRQLPGPISIPLFGPPDDTGAFVFRRIIGLHSTRSGFGYSLAAEGYLNFGPSGTFGILAIVGWVFGRGYRRFRGAASRVSDIFYPLLLASLPFGLRSDVLGATKSVLYPAILLSLAFAVAHKSGFFQEKRDGIGAAGSAADALHDH